MVSKPLLRVNELRSELYGTYLVSTSSPGRHTTGLPQPQVPDVTADGV